MEQDAATNCSLHKGQKLLSELVLVLSVVQVMTTTHGGGFIFMLQLVLYIHTSLEDTFP